MKIIVSVIVIMLMIGAQSAGAKHSSDVMPPGSKSASGDDVSGFAKLPKGQHYGQCEEVGKDNELGCDIINESDLPNGYKQGLKDAKNGITPVGKLTNHTGDYNDGYIFGYCSINGSAQYHIPYHDNVSQFDLDCSQPVYPGP
jgi:hypothetical protein